jgi:hypothetical protein
MSSVFSDKSLHTRRWYDAYPTVAKAFNTLRDYSPQLHRLFGQIIFTYYENLQYQKKLDRQVVSVGAERALSLWKIQAKRRVEDQDQLLYKAMSTLYLIDERQRLVIAEAISAGLLCVRQYETCCRKQSLVEKEIEMKEAFKLAMENGMAAGEEYLRSLGLNIPREPSHLEKLENQRKVELAKLAFKQQWKNTYQKEKEPVPSVEEGKLALPTEPVSVHVEVEQSDLKLKPDH